jgi:hypothetical protein
VVVAPQRRAPRVPPVPDTSPDERTIGCPVDGAFQFSDRLGVQAGMTNCRCLLDKKLWRTWRGEAATVRCVMPGQLHGLGGWRRNRPCPPNALATEKPGALAFRAGGLDCPPLRCLAGLKSAAGIGPERPVLASLSNLASSGLKTRLRKRPRAGALPTGGEFGGRRAGSQQRRERGGCSLLCEAARGVTRPSNGMLTLRVRRALAARFGSQKAP